MHNSDVVGIVASKLSGYETTAEQICRSRFMICCLDEGLNDVEKEEVIKISNSFRYYKKITGNEIQLGREYLQSPYNEIIENGMPAPYTGGTGGLVHMPDGSTKPSNVPIQLWGQEIPEYAKAGTSAFEETDKIQQTLFPQEVRNAVQGSHSELTQLAKKDILKQIKQARMG